MDFYTVILQQMTYFPRMFVALQTLTVMGQQTVPRPVMNGLCIALIFILPAPTPEELAAWGQSMGLVVLALKEAAVGFLIGFAFSLVFALAETAGQFIDHQSGLTFSQNIDPVNGNQTSPTGVLLLQFAYMVFWATGGMLIFIRSLYDSFLWWPTRMLSPAPAQALGLQAGDWIAQWFALAFMVASAVMIILLLIDFGFGMLGRAAPNLNLGQLTFIFKGLVVVAVLTLSMGAFADSVRLALQFVSGSIESLLGRR
jgi:type III secretion protein T